MQPCKCDQSDKRKTAKIQLLCFSDNVGKIRVFSIKVALATLCAGKLMDKLRCKFCLTTKSLHCKLFNCFQDIFSQISDSNGLLLTWRFNEYLQEVLALPAAVYESPTFNYTDSLASTIFSPVTTLQKT